MRISKLAILAAIVVDSNGGIQDVTFPVEVTAP